MTCHREILICAIFNAKFKLTWTDLWSRRAGISGFLFWPFHIPRDPCVSTGRSHWPGPSQWEPPKDPPWKVQTFLAYPQIAVDPKRLTWPWLPKEMEYLWEPTSVCPVGEGFCRLSLRLAHITITIHDLSPDFKPTFLTCKLIIEYHKLQGSCQMRFLLFLDIILIGHTHEAPGHELLVWWSWKIEWDQLVTEQEAGWRGPSALSTCLQAFPVPQMSGKLWLPYCVWNAFPGFCAYWY